MNETSSAHMSLRPTRIPIYSSTVMNIVSSSTTMKPFLTTSKSRPVVRPTPINSWMQDIPSGHSSNSHSSHTNYDLYKNKTTITEPKNNGNVTIDNIKNIFVQLLPLFTIQFAVNQEEMVALLEVTKHIPVNGHGW